MYLACPMCTWKRYKRASQSHHFEQLSVCIIPLKGLENTSKQTLFQLLPHAPPPSLQVEVLPPEVHWMWVTVCVCVWLVCVCALLLSANCAFMSTIPATTTTQLNALWGRCHRQQQQQPLCHCRSHSPSQSDACLKLSWGGGLREHRREGTHIHTPESIWKNNQHF